jgi:hypothetical protein
MKASVLICPVECYLYLLFEVLFWWMGIKFAVLKQGAPTYLILWDTWHKIYSSWATHNNIRCKNVEDWINILVVDEAWILWISHTLLKGLNKFVSTSHISLLTLVKFKTKNRHVGVLNNCDFCENWHTANHTVIIAYLQLYRYFWHLLSTVGKSLSKKCAHHAAEDLWGLWKVAHGRKYFSCSCKWNYV